MYIVKLPSAEYLNLAFVQRVEVHLDVPIVMIYWSGGSKNLYRNENAKAIVQSMDYIAAVNIPKAEKVAQDIFNTFHPVDAI